MLGLAQACTEKGGRTGKAAVSTDNCIGNKLADEANQLRFAFQRGQQFLQRLQQSYAVLAENVDALAAVKREVNIPVVTGEELYTKFEFREVFENCNREWFIVPQDRLPEAKKLFVKLFESL